MSGSRKSAPFSSRNMLELSYTSAPLSTYVIPWRNMWYAKLGQLAGRSERVAHVILGNIALRKRDAPAALQEFQTYLKLDPKGPMAPGTEAMVKKIQEALNHPQ
jgi:hypothetical protein